MTLKNIMLGITSNIIYDFSDNNKIQITFGTIKETVTSDNNNFIFGNERLADITKIMADNYSVTEIKNYEPIAQDNYQLLMNSNKKITNH